MVLSSTLVCSTCSPGVGWGTDQFNGEDSPSHSKFFPGSFNLTRDAERDIRKLKRTLESASKGVSSRVGRPGPGGQKRLDDSRFHIREGDVRGRGGTLGPINPIRSTSHACSVVKANFFTCARSCFSQDFSLLMSAFSLLISPVSSLSVNLLSPDTFSGANGARPVSYYAVLHRMADSKPTPAISDLGWPFTPSHKSSPYFATYVGSVLQGLLELSSNLPLIHRIGLGQIGRTRRFHLWKAPTPNGLSRCSHFLADPSCKRYAVRVSALD
ncbi:hypothetical protein Tco_0470820 [Tanacetum coccineum]